MFTKLLLLFIVVPLAEVALLALLTQWMGFWNTVLLVIVTGAVGAWLAQLQGYRAFSRIRQDVASGKMPADSGFDGLLIFLAGALLMTPGVLTDLTGFLLLVPISRAFVKQWLGQWLRQRFQIQGLRHSADQASGQFSQDGDIIESYVVRSNDDDN